MFAKWLSEINSIEKPLQKTTTNVGGKKIVRSFVRSSRTFFVGVIIFSTAQIFRKNRSGRRDRVRQKIVEIGAILAIFRLFEVLDGKFSDRRARRLRRRRRRLGRGGRRRPSTGAAASSAAPPPRARGRRRGHRRAFDRGATAPRSNDLKIPKITLLILKSINAVR